MLSFIFYVIIKRKRGFCCKPAVDIIKFFKVVKFYCGSRDSLSFLLHVSLHFSELKAQDGAPRWWLAHATGLLGLCAAVSSAPRSRVLAMKLAFAPVFCLRAMGPRASKVSQFRADSRGSRYEGFAGKNWQDGLNGKFWSSAPPTTSSQFNYFIALNC